jgi:hypothetical protein
MSDIPVMEQFGVFVVKVIGPSPEPPEVLRMMGIPIVPMRVVLEIARVAWAIGAVLKKKLFELDVVDR